MSPDWDQSTARVTVKTPLYDEAGSPSISFVCGDFLFGPGQPGIFFKVLVDQEIFAR